MSWRGGGVRSWVVQRISATYMALFFILSIAFLAGVGGLDYARWYTLLSAPVFNVLLLMFFIALLLHAWVGMRDVILDYVAPDGIRFVVLSLFALYLVAIGVWVIRILFMPLSLI